MEPTIYMRSPELLQRQDSALVVVDVQEKLAPLVQNQQRLIWNVRRLLDAAKTLEIPALGTEQYPRGLGPTVDELTSYFSELPAKLSFSCAGCDQFAASLKGAGRTKVLLVGMETHVCVQQTALDLISEGYRVYVAVDAVSSRSTLDHDVALRRMENLGATLTTTEAVIFEWCEAAGTDEFKVLRKLVTETPPA